MAFKIFSNSTVVDYADCNNQYYHIGQGSRLPMGGNYLTATTGIYDLGASTAVWNNLHCNNINVSGSITTANKSLWVLLSEVTLSAASSLIEFTGLNGDNDLEYRITSIVDVNVNCPMYLYLNGDSIQTDYGYQYIMGSDTNTTAARAELYAGINVNAVLYSSGYGFSDINLSAVGNIKLCHISTMSHAASTTIFMIREVSAVWNNSATLTSMKFTLGTTTAVFSTNTSVQLWKRG